MIRLEIVNLLLEDNGPEIFAEEFYDVQIIGKARSVSREAEISTIS